MINSFWYASLQSEVNQLLDMHDSENGLIEMLNSMKCCTLTVSVII